MGERRRIFVGILIIILATAGYLYYNFANLQQPPAKVFLEIPKILETNQEISVPLKLSSSETMNAAEFFFSFPTDLVEVVSIDTTGSIYSLWVTGSPKFDNITGTLSFEGGLPTPGFSGDNGLIATVVFRTKNAGSGEITIDTEKSRVLANDGLGTSIETRFLPVSLEIR